jgi:hypothetical protein
MSTTGDCIMVSEDRLKIYQDKILLQRSLTQKGKPTRVGAGSPWLPRSSRILYIVIDLSDLAASV